MTQHQCTSPESPPRSCRQIHGMLSLLSALSWLTSSLSIIPSSAASLRCPPPRPQPPPPRPPGARCARPPTSPHRRLTTTTSHPPQRHPPAFRSSAPPAPPPSSRPPPPRPPRASRRPPRAARSPSFRPGTPSSPSPSSASSSPRACRPPALRQVTNKRGRYCRVSCKRIVTGVTQEHTSPVRRSAGESAGSRARLALAPAVVVAVVAPALVAPAVVVAAPPAPVHPEVLVSRVVAVALLPLRSGGGGARGVPTRRRGGGCALLPSLGGGGRLLLPDRLRPVSSPGRRHKHTPRQPPQHSQADAPTQRTGKNISHPHPAQPPSPAHTNRSPARLPAT